jgi:hypothetical protein
VSIKNGDRLLQPRNLNIHEGTAAPKAKKKNWRALRRRPACPVPRRTWLPVDAGCRATKQEGERRQQRQKYMRSFAYCEADATTSSRRRPEWLMIEYGITQGGGAREKLVL